MPPKIIVGVPSREEARWSRFYECLGALRTPDAPVMHLKTSRGKSPSANRNAIIGEAIKQGAEAVYFCDDDMFPTPEVVLRLWEHNKDAVSALYPMAHEPFWPCIFDEQQPDGAVYPMFLGEKHNGLKRVKAVGGGALLCRTEIFTRPGWPIGRKGRTCWWTLGQVELDEWCDDTYFSLCLRNVGAELWCDFDLSVEHAAWFGLRCVRSPEGEWLLQLSQRGKRLLNFPATELQRISLEEMTQKQLAQEAENGQRPTLAGSALSIEPPVPIRSSRRSVATLKADELPEVAETLFHLGGKRVLEGDTGHLSLEEGQDDGA